MDKKLDEGVFSASSCDLEHGTVEAFLDCISLGPWVPIKENIENFLLLNVIIKAKSFAP